MNNNICILFMQIWIVFSYEWERRGQSNDDVLMQSKSTVPEKKNTYVEKKVTNGNAQE